MLTPAYTKNLTDPDGTAKRIDEVKVGEEVIATEPESGRSSVRRVLATLPHADYLLALRTSAGQIMTTEDHYFWNATDLVWQESRQLDAGDRLLAAGSGEVLVEGINLSTISYDSAYDLTIEGVHTYYVGVGDQYVLVHNADCGRGIWEITKEGTDRTLRNDRFGTFSRSKSDGLWWSKDQAGHGGSAWKVFEERGDGLHWIADADEYGDFIVGKDKSPTGQFIPWDELN